MGWTITHDPAVYEKAAGEFLHSDPVRHTVLISVLNRLQKQGLSLYGDKPPHFGWWTTPGGAVTAAFFRTPPYGISVSPLPSDAVDPLIRAYAAIDPALTSVFGPAAAARAFADAWGTLHGTAVSLARADRLYRLGELISPDPVPEGAGRVATVRDRDLLIEWFIEFTRDIGDPPTAHPDRLVDAGIARGGLSIWELDGTPVSMAGFGPDVAGAVRIAPVYTPKSLRRNGFAAGATVYACRAALGTGARDIMLFADRANLTSTALYQRIGFRPIDDFNSFRLA